jgi:hypothetical protein
VHVDCGEEENHIVELWPQYVEAPLTQARLPVPQLHVVKSPFRYVITPIYKFVLDLERRHTDRQIAVVVPNLVERRWYQRFLHNQRGELLTALLLVKGNQRIAIINVPWYLKTG